MQTLKEIVANAVNAAGCQFVGLEDVQSGRHHVLRIYIDGENGVTIDDCGRVSKQVGAVLDVEDAIQHQYTLEVSSPGINRLLFEKEQYGKYIGETLKIRLKFAQDGRKQFSGQLIKVEDDGVTLSVQDEEHKLLFSDIAKARAMMERQ